MVIKRFYSLLLFCVAVVATFAQAPSDYYVSASGQKAAALKTALYNIIKDHTELSYADLWTAFYKTDVRSDDKVWDIYSDIPNGTPQYLYSFGDNQCGSYSEEGDCYNREHSFPRSWFGDATPMYTDLFHIYPTDGYVNGKRSNYPYGEVGIATYTSSNGSKLGQCSFTGYTGTVFEPIDEYKGDLARSYFYMATCYEDKIASWASNTEAEPLLAGNSYPAFKDWMVNLLLKWSREDTVSQKEIDRNNAIYAIQGNRNPYIDHPELVEYVWGDKTDEAFVLDGPVISVSTSGTIDFGKNTPGTSSYKTITLQAYNISGDISLALSGTNASKFSVSSTYVSEADALAGQEITINYLSNEVSTDSATLTISGGGASDVVLSLVGQSSNDFLALAASNISSTSFQANWTKSDNATGYILNIFQKEQTGNQKEILFDYSFSDGFPSAFTLDGYYTTTELSGAVRLASGSNYGLLTTSTLATNEKSILTVNAKQYSNDTGAPIYVSVGGVAIDTLVTTSTFQDFTVEIPAGYENSTITLLANKKARVYISAMSLETEGVTTENVSLENFPVTLGDVYAYVASNLTENSTYYYTVQPIGGNDSISSEIEVNTTSTSSSISQSSTDKGVAVYKSGNGFVIENLDGNLTAYIYDTAGQLLKKVTMTSSSAYIPFNFKGSYIVTIQSDNGRQSFKLMF